MRDQGHEETDKVLQRVERQLTKEYTRAAKDLRKKLEDYLAKYDKKNAVKEKQLADGEISQQQYNEWRLGQVMMGKRWEEMLDTITADLHNVNQIARSTINGYMPEVYALNHDYGTFLVEKGALVDTSYTLYNREAVERMFRENPKLYHDPGRKKAQAIREGKETRWNKQKIRSLMTQSILQGDGVREIAKKLAIETCDSNRKTAMRNARTMANGVENAGRQDAYKRAEDKGIKVKRTWMASLDSKTRHTHRQMDGVTVGVDEPFEMYSEYTGQMEKLMRPCDPDGPPDLVYNCRCTTIPQIEGFERDLSDLSLRRSRLDDDTTYEEWREAKRKKVRE